MSGRNHCLPAKSPMGSERGFSIVELMVAIVISLLVVLAAMGSAQSFLSIQRQSSAVGTAYTSALSALAALKYEAAHAGLGLYVDGTMPCKALNLSLNTTTHSEEALFLPLSITSTALNRTTLTVAYATALEGGTPGFLKEDADSTSETVEIKNHLPILLGQAVVLAPPAAVAGTCTVRTVTATTPPTAPPALPEGLKLHFAATGAHNKVAFATAVSYPANSQVFVVGRYRVSRFVLNNGVLTMEQPLDANSSPVVLARDVMAFTAQYGVTKGDIDSLDGWRFAEEYPDLSEDWRILDEVKVQRVKALRLGIVVRAGQRDKPDEGGNCTAAAVQPELFGRSLALIGDWQCFKYRTVTVVVPLRNMMMGASAS